MRERRGELGTRVVREEEEADEKGREEGRNGKREEERTRLGARARFVTSSFVEIVTRENGGHADNAKDDSEQKWRETDSAIGRQRDRHRLDRHRDETSSVGYCSRSPSHSSLGVSFYHSPKNKPAAALAFV